MTSRKERIELLRLSVQKWSKIAVGLGCDNMSDNCELCQHCSWDCELCQHYGWDCGANSRKNRCPVFEYTGMEGCVGSPWEEWRDHQVCAHGRAIPYWAECGECRELANKELMFLQGLLEVELEE